MSQSVMDIRICRLNIRHSKRKRSLKLNLFWIVTSGVTGQHGSSELSDLAEESDLFF